MVNVAFLGLGKMGQGMARRLLAAGHRVSVFNRTAVRTAGFAEEGAIVCTSPRDACHCAAAVVSMTSDDEASRALWLGSEGVVTADTMPGALAVECSTLSHDWVMELASAVSARGMRYIDAPVTGLPDAAAAGELTLLVGAEARDLDAARRVFEALATRVLHFGAVGSGTAYKLLINLIGAVQIASAAEGMVMAQRAGLDLGVVADAIASGQAASPQVVRNTRRMANGDHDQNVVFTPVLRLKDVEYALRFARKLGVASPFGEVAASLLRKLIERGDAHANESKIFELLRGLELPVEGCG